MSVAQAQPHYQFSFLLGSCADYTLVLPHIYKICVVRHYIAYIALVLLTLLILIRQLPVRLFNVQGATQVTLWMTHCDCQW